MKRMISYLQNLWDKIFHPNGKRTLNCTLLEGEPLHAPVIEKADIALLRSAGKEGEIKRFRLALSCDADYASKVGGTVASVMAAMRTTVANSNIILERDFGVRLEIIPENEQLIWLSKTAPGYPYNPFGNGGLNIQVQKFLTSKIGNSKYDLGVVLSGSTVGSSAGCIGGVMKDDLPSVPVTATSKSKGKCVVASTKPYGKIFDIDYFTHEVSHMLGAYHTLSCYQENTYAQVEPGSGTTIMGYAGITGSNYNVETQSDTYFNGLTILQVSLVLKDITPVLPSIFNGNKTPVCNAGIDYVMPKNTPFVLTGTGTDGNKDSISYCWEQMDSYGSGIPSPTVMAGPNFRSYPPVNVPYRYFPALKHLSAGVNYKWEVLPNRTATNEVSRRILTFRLTVRDGKGETNFDDCRITFSNIVGPFQVTSQSIPQVYEEGSIQEIKWDVAGTTANGINCSKVDILMSTDGGLTFPITLKTTDNIGSGFVTIPSNIGTKNRFMVKGNNHIFFNINKADFTIKDKPVVIPPVFPPDVDDEVTNAPLNFRVSNITRTGCRLDWDKNLNFVATSYSIYKNRSCENNALTGLPCEGYLSATSGLNFTISGLSPNTEYKFDVKGKNTLGERSERTKIITIKTLP